MKIVIFGATGMVGRGVLRECLARGGGTHTIAIGRASCGVVHPRLTEIVTPDLFALPETVISALADRDACFFCLGVSSSGLREADYTRMTYDLMLAIATPLAGCCPAMTFVYVSGAGTDAASRSMWARVKGRTEQALAALPFTAVYSLRPGVILPMNGERSKVAAYRWIYRILGPLMRVARPFAPAVLLTTETLGRAMLCLAEAKPGRAILGSADIDRLSRRTI